MTGGASLPAETIDLHPLAGANGWICWCSQVKFSHFTEVLGDIDIRAKGSFFQGEVLWPAGLEETTHSLGPIVCGGIQDLYTDTQAHLCLWTLYFLPSLLGFSFTVVGTPVRANSPNSFFYLAVTLLLPFTLRRVLMWPKGTRYPPHAPVETSEGWIWTLENSTKTKTWIFFPTVDIIFSEVQ